MVSIMLEKQEGTKSKPSAAFPLPLTQGATPLPTSAHPRGDPQKPGQRQLLSMEARAGELRREQLTFCWEEGERGRRKPPKCQRHGTTREASFSSLLRVK